ncbi:MBL fold metallo-hydrolase [Thermoflavimicrobium dichotomicum]|uniref:Glyoxylase, beta-lactamase superfamily II n=1 Tax=Thermoflavimicrobium dichotomicum TaxID=46223 RepID=A0A1I3N8T3_9BACL|nr:MBL fold metallo-hydrolase [Thermoflavimicrobium dichotomicum]SFJ05450.1 Glyoxylase, beta-lactamase superfamily II [Thermoflavimicrobium dichotomicum]
MKIETFTLGPVMTNAYLVYDEQVHKGIVFDPGMYPEPLVKRIQTLGLEIEAILLTHAHFDHIGGVEEVREQSKAPVYVHEKEADWLGNPQLNGSGLFPGIPETICKPADHILKGGETLAFLGQTFKVFHTPGHSPGSVSYLTGSLLFSGDVLFYGSIGRTDLPGGSMEQLMQSIHQHLLELPDETRVLCGHGPETTIGREKDSNPYIAGW